MDGLFVQGYTTFRKDVIDLRAKSLLLNLHFSPNLPSHYCHDTHIGAVLL